MHAVGFRRSQASHHLRRHHTDLAARHSHQITVRHLLTPILRESLPPLRLDRNFDPQAESRSAAPYLRCPLPHHLTANLRHLS